MTAFLSFTAATAEVLNPAKSQVKLLEFTVDATATDMRTLLKCSNTEVLKAVQHLISFSDKDNSLRDLKPTYRPLDNEAAWILKQEDCPGLKPYINGIGFHSYDEKTGDAVIYVSAFNQMKSNDREWSNNSGLGRMRMIFQPDYDVINVIKFPAKCEQVLVGKLSLIGVGEPQLVCTLNDKKGSVKFSVHAR